MIECGINELLLYAKGNPGNIVTSIATAVIAGSSICTYRATKKIAEENKILRKSNERPELIVYMERQAFYREVDYYGILFYHCFIQFPARSLARH